METHPSFDTRLFLLYWMGWWMPLAALAGLVTNPLSSDFVKAFWNPPVWIAMVPVCGVLAWLCVRSHARIKAVVTNKTVDRTCAALAFAGEGWTMCSHPDILAKLSGAFLWLLAIAVGSRAGADIAGWVSERRAAQSARRSVGRADRSE